MSDLKSAQRLARARTILQPAPDITAQIKAQIADSTPAPSESKHDRFVRVGNPRARRIIVAMRRLAMLGTPRYERHPDEIDNLEKVLRAELDTTLTKLRNGLEAPVKDIF